MSFVKNAPSVFTSNIQNIPFNSLEEKNQIIETIAERISSIYAAFLTADWHAKRAENQCLAFFDFPKAFPSTNEVRKFKVNLRDAIVNELNKGNEHYDIVYLSTGYAPEMLLDAVLEKSGIIWQKYPVNKLFPEMTGTSIYVWDEYQEVRIRMIPSWPSCDESTKDNSVQKQSPIAPRRHHKRRHRRVNIPQLVFVPEKLS